MLKDTQGLLTLQNAQGRDGTGRGQRSKERRRSRNKNAIFIVYLIFISVFLLIINHYRYRNLILILAERILLNFQGFRQVENILKISLEPINVGPYRTNAERIGTDNWRTVNDRLQTSAWVDKFVPKMLFLRTNIIDTMQKFIVNNQSVY